MTRSRVRVGVTRDGNGADRLAQLLADQDLEPVVVPLITRGDAADGGLALRTGLAMAGPDGWIVVTSPNGAAALLDALGSDRLPDDVRIGAVGPATAERLRTGGLTVDLVPERYDAATLARTLLATSERSRALVALSALADDTLESALVDGGWQVERVEAYRIVPRTPTAAEAGELARCRLVTLASGSAATGLAAVTTAIPVVCMGEATARRARQSGLDVRGVADPSNLEGLVAATTLALEHIEDVHEEMTEQ